MHGPPNTYPPDPETGREYLPTEFPNLPRIKVLDTVALEFSPRRAKKWRALRDDALAVWEYAGNFQFVVTEDFAAKYPTYDPKIPNEYDRLMAPMIPETIRLIKTPRLLGRSVQAFAVFAHPGAWAAYKLGKRFWLFSTPRRKRYLLRHEIGHCFGLKDRYALPNLADRTGVMASDIEPDSHDIKSLRTYYRL